MYAIKKSIKLTCLLVSLRFSHYSALKNKILLERALSLTPMDRKSHCWTELLLLEINASPHHWKSLQDQSFHELIFCWCMSHKIIQLPFCGCTGSSKLAREKKALKTSFIQWIKQLWCRSDIGDDLWSGKVPFLHSLFLNHPAAQLTATWAHLLCPPTAPGGICNTLSQEEALRIKFLSQLQIALFFVVIS